MRPLENKTLTLPAGAVTELMQAVLDKGGLFRFCGRGKSMTPFIRDGDILTIAPLASRPPRLGEVVAFSCPTGEGPTLVVHRVVGRRRRGFIVRGDENDSTAEIVFLENILGRLVKVERDGRYVRLGLGPERRLIAWLSRSRSLWKVAWPIWSEVRKLWKLRNSSHTDSQSNR